MKAYLIPGLGYDSSIFAHLKFSDHAVENIPWIEPQENERIGDYAKRMFAEVDLEKEEIVLIGHSFGGILAQEVAAIKKVRKIILLSSIKSRRELPGYFKWVAPLRLDKFFTKELALGTVKYWGGRHGFKTPAEQRLFQRMVSQQSNAYLQWALRTLSNWEAPSLPAATRIFQLHGTADKTFPIHKIEHPQIVIEGGSHLMLFHRHEEISAILQREIDRQ